ncbi:Oxoglutarate/iron-dependent dioxygenase [Corchorus olitorius]|uniref:Oxoglutarate/iron-dependent dioxygenase n=1 Tax=Corchorus olitorius TaxID=93759 RepID=A0A1R3I9B7_9ROSI|nr:Oxoglutarate/iron-dependent dioxygenase [Corchorus olitorius]
MEIKKRNKEVIVGSGYWPPYLYDMPSSQVVHNFCSLLDMPPLLKVDPLPGSLLVNLGDMATVWSKGRFHNVKHRVQCKEATTRVSIATLLLGPKGAVEPPPQLVDLDHPRLFAPFTYEEYIKLRLSKNLQAGEAIQLLRTQ